MDIPVTVTEILSAFDEKHWKTQTVNTFMTRLVEKGLLSVEKRMKTNYYTPIITEREYQQFEAKNMLDSVYNGSLGSFLSALFGEKVKPSEVEELKDWFEKAGIDD
jgi:predicted transcriptional regulator